MKNNLLILSLAFGALLASACVKMEVGLDNTCISFSPLAAKPTKAIISGTSYPTSESFTVSAFYEGADAYFENMTASYSSSLSLWETSDPEYWPLGGSLLFQAYSPSDASGVSITSTGIQATGYVVRTAAQRSTDLCYASATVADCSSHPDAVDLVFNHALSQVVFRVKASSYYSTASRTVSLSLTSLSLDGLMSEGDFSGGAWENLSSVQNYNLSDSSTPLTYDGENNPQTTEVCASLFLPQELSVDAALRVGYSVSQTVGGNTYTLENSPVTVRLRNTVTQWEPGKKYIYTINIGMDNVITISASTVGWADENFEIIVEES